MRSDVRDVLRRDARLVTVEMRESHWAQQPIRQPTLLFQAFLAATPRHPVVRTYLRELASFYRALPGKRGGMSAAHPIIADGLLGVFMLGRALDRYLRRATNATTATSTASDRRSVQLLQEVNLHYHPWLAHVPRQDGEGCCCDWVVHDPCSAAVPFYSRMVGVPTCQHRATSWLSWLWPTGRRRR